MKGVTYSCMCTHCVRRTHETRVSFTFQAYFVFFVSIYFPFCFWHNMHEKKEREKKTIKHFSTSIHKGIHVWRTLYFGFAIACFNNSFFHWILQSSGYSSMVYFFFPLDECHFLDSNFNNRKSSMKIQCKNLHLHHYNVVIL